MSRRILALGPDQGWHAERLRQAALAAGDEICWARYESLRVGIEKSGRQQVSAINSADGGALDVSQFDHILVRTMPAGSLEQITLRLSILHSLVERGQSVVNSPTGMEWAIDKYRTLARIALLGFPVPETRVVQTRREAMDAFDALGGDVISKPLFGGEGRGVTRLIDREVAWYSFAVLEQLNAVIYLQRFVPPGGSDTRLLVIGEDVFGIQRWAAKGWKTNVSQGAACKAIEPTAEQRQLALRIAREFNLRIAAIDAIDCEDGIAKILEVNAVPGWKGAERALGIDLAAVMLAALNGRETLQDCK